MKFTFSPESRVLDGYTIKRAIYRGGFGEVYYALSDAGREVALKLLQNNADIELRGVQQCLNLSHPNLVTIFDVREDADGDHWILMEYVSGETLDAAVRRHPDGMPMEEVCRWLKGIAAGVGHLHSRGLVHRDLKPANIFSGEGAIKVGDVGLSKFITHSRRSAQTQSVGTVYYMAPEVANGRYGKEVDIYALGVMLYEMLTGSLPFDGESTAEILMKHLTAAPDLSLLPPRVRPVIGRALEKSPDRRFASVEAFEQAFHAAVVGKSEVLDLPDDAFLPVTHAAPTSPTVAPAAAKALPVVAAIELGDGRQGVPRVNSTPHPPASQSHTPQPFPKCLWPTGRVWWGIFLIGAMFSLVGLFLDWAGAGRLGDATCVLVFLGLFLGFVLSGIRHATIGPWSFEHGQSAYAKTAIYFPTGRWQALVQVGGFTGLFFFSNVIHSTDDVLPLCYWAWGMLAAYLGTVAVRASQPSQPVVNSVWDISDAAEQTEPQFVESLPASTRSEAALAFRRLDAQHWRLKSRWAEWLQSAALAPLAVSLFMVAMAIVAPSFFMNPSAGGIDPNVLAFLGLSALVTVWGTMLVAKMTERQRAVSTSKWWFTGTGALIGCAVAALHQVLMVDAAFSLDRTAHSAIFSHISELPLFEQGTGPTLAGFVVFFAGLLALRAWPRQIDRDRKARFRIGALLMTVLTAWLWGSVFIFPRVWGMLLAAVVSASVQVLSVWSADRAARKHGGS